MFFHYNDTANSENVGNIHTAWKAKSFSVVISHTRKNSQGYGFSVNEINSIAIIYNHPIYLFTSYVIKINK